MGLIRESKDPCFLQPCLYLDVPRPQQITHPCIESEASFGYTVNRGHAAAQEKYYTVLAEISTEHHRDEAAEQFRISRIVQWQVGIYPTGIQENQSKGTWLSRSKPWAC